MGSGFIVMSCGFIVMGCGFMGMGCGFMGMSFAVGSTGSGFIVMGQRSGACFHPLISCRGKKRGGLLVCLKGNK